MNTNWDKAQISCLAKQQIRSLILCKKRYGYLLLVSCLYSGGDDVQYKPNQSHEAQLCLRFFA